MKSPIRHLAAEHHDQAASHHHAAAHHHHQASHFYDLGDPASAVRHATAALEHSDLAHRFAGTAQAHIQGLPDGVSER